MTLCQHDIYSALHGTSPHPSLSGRVISRFVIDSRQAIPDSCFLAFRGENTDGHQYIAAAIQRGARTIIAETLPPGITATTVRPSHEAAPDPGRGPLVFIVPDTLQALQQLAATWRRQHQPTVVGITGSVGKTSTKELAAAVLRQRYPTLWNQGNLNNEIGLPLTLLDLEAQHAYAVLEMGFYLEGEIAQLCRLAQPHIGIITNIGPIHLERAGSMEAIFRGKSELVQALPADGYAILNWDDEWVRKMAPLSPAPIFRYGLNPEVDLWADNIQSEGLEGIRFRFHYRRSATQTEVLHVHLPLLGRHSVHTALRAAALGLICQLSWEEIIRGLHDINAQVRIEVTPGIHQSTILDDTYNASPPSSIAALNLLSDLEGRHVAVLGDMLELGAYEETGHRLVGRKAADIADMLFTIGPRARWIAEEAVLGGLEASQVYHFDAMVEAQPVLQQLIQKGDQILIKGSRALGMEKLVAALSVAPIVS